MWGVQTIVYAICFERTPRLARRRGQPFQRAFSRLDCDHEPFRDVTAHFVAAAVGRIDAG
jgi:hypothetical protein